MEKSDSGASFGEKIMVWMGAIKVIKRKPKSSVELKTAKKSKEN